MAIAAKPSGALHPLFGRTPLPPSSVSSVLSPLSPPPRRLLWLVSGSRRGRLPATPTEPQRSLLARPHPHRPVRVLRLGPGRSRGYALDFQVGVSGFRFDIGVRHPQRPHRYLPGVECDGARYHSSKSARARDRLREEILAGYDCDTRLASSRN
ncbi:hypothetical protein [Salinarimonas sp.]|uniref:hypothetical protein n=1 Tax=Salinarimonas sp. TaxID=2766526 RepID=UPI00391954C3